MLSLPLVGEDYLLLSRVRAGEAAYPHVFRPLPGLWLRALHAVCGADHPQPYHAASLALHALNAVLLYHAARAVLGRRAPALLAALLFAAGAVACDALAWTSAVNRPVSAVGLLVAWNGLARWRTHPRLAPALLAAGFVFQALALEEVYGTALFAAAWLALQAARGARPRAALAGAAAVLCAAALHYLFLQRVPGGAGEVVSAGLRAAPANALARSRDVVAGFGVPGRLAGLWPPALILLLAGMRRLELAAFAGLAWLASFVPYALDDPVLYRSYTTLAPTALIAAAALHALAGRRPRVEAVACAAAGALLCLGAAGPRAERLARWRAATREPAAIDQLVRAHAWSPPKALPALVNLDTSSSGVLVYRFGLEDLGALRAVDFLDAAGGSVPPAAPPPRPWIGRRADGSYGELDPGTYFDGRPALPELRLAGRLYRAGGLAEARALLADREVDLAHAAVAETDVEALGLLSAAGEIQVLEPFTGDAVAATGRMRVAVRAAAPTVLAVCSSWQYSHMMRVAQDQMLFSGVEHARVLRLEARVAGEAAPRNGFFLDAFGFGVALPAGEHDVELRWRRATPDELRRGPAQE